MKFVSVRDAKAHLSDCLDASQGESVVVTHHGKPKSIVIGVEGYALDEVVLMLNPDFWELIESRRRQPRSSLEDFEKELTSKGSPRRRRRAARKTG